MRNSLLQEYSLKHVHFYDSDVPFLLEKGLVLVNRTVRKPKVIDLGCGDGRVIFALYKRGLLKIFGEVVGVDISEIRIRRLTAQMPFVKGVVSNALNVKELPDSYFDFVICSQLIEHVEDDDALIQEIKRLLKAGGLAYISSVIKEWYGIYFYFKDGSFRLDPTHVREYPSVERFMELFKKEGFEVLEAATRRVRYPLSHLVIRLMIRFGIIYPNVNVYPQSKILGKFRRVQMPIFGYKSVEVLVKKVG